MTLAGCPYEPSGKDETTGSTDTGGTTAAPDGGTTEPPETPTTGGSEETTSGSSDSSSSSGTTAPTTGAVDPCGDGTCAPDEDNSTCPDDCPVPPSCGDGVLDPGETCDDADADNTDACIDTCSLARCGDAYIHAGEEVCDDGDLLNGDNWDAASHCNATCTALAPHCGDGSCQAEHEDANACPAECVPTCGNSAVEGDEQCDDGVGLVPTDSGACDDDCTPAACGDGHVNMAAGELCDDANLVETDACAACQPASCGDGIVQIGVETCDDGNLNDLDACSDACAPQRRVFVTSQPYYTGQEIGGLAGADAKCQVRAAAAGLGVTFKAWLSDANKGPASPGRLDTTFKGHYILIDGTSIAEGWADLTDGTLAHPIDLDENNAPPTPNAAVWTNTSPQGTPLNEHCTNWTVNDVSGIYGRTIDTDGKWTWFPVSSGCLGAYPIYCFEQP